MADYNNNQTSKDLVDKIRATLGCCLVHRMNNLEELKYATENQIVTASCCDSHQQEKCRQFLRDQSFQLMRWEDLNGIVVTEVTTIAALNLFSIILTYFVFPIGMYSTNRRYE